MTRPPVASPAASPRVPVLAAYRCAPLECAGSERNEAAWQSSELDQRNFLDVLLPCDFEDSGVL